MNDDDFVRIGVITGTHGLRGRLRIYIVTDIIERFTPGNRVYLNEKSFTVSEFSFHKDSIGLLKLEGIDSVDQAATHKGADLLISREDAQRYRNNLDEESYFTADIINSGVFYQDSHFGTVHDILHAGAEDVLIIKGNDGREYMVPFVKSMVDTSRLDEKRIDIDPVEGLFDI